MSSSSFQDKVYAITGGASGMGLSIAKILLERGAKISIADVNEENLSAAAQNLSAPDSHLLTFPCNVRSFSSVQSWISTTIDKFGRLDGAANFAGIISKQHGNLIEEQDEEEWERVIGVNLTGVMFCMKCQLKVMGKGGSIVNAASVAGVRGLPGSAAYGVSKCGVIGLTRSSARDYATKNIRINAVAPGYISTPMLSQSETLNGIAKVDAGVQTNCPMQRRAEPEEVARVAVFLLSGEASYVTGQVWSVDGGWNS